MDDQVVQDYEEYKARGRIWGGVPQDSIKRIKFPRIDRTVIEQFLALDDLTGSISDVLDTVGIKGAIPASYLPPLLPSSKIAGTAITLRSIPERKTVTKGLMDKDCIRMATRDTHYLAELGDILVADFGGNLDVSNMGGPVCDRGAVVRRHRSHRERRGARCAFLSKTELSDLVPWYNPDHW